MKIPRYPEEFFSFKDGFEISDNEINIWIKECCDFLDKHKDADIAIRASGNTKVTAQRCYWEDNGECYYEITVAKVFAEADAVVG